MNKHVELRIFCSPDSDFHGTASDVLAPMDDTSKHRRFQYEEVSTVRFDSFNANIAFSLLRKKHVAVHKCSNFATIL